MFFPECSLQNEVGDAPFFFTFLTSPTDHLSIVKVLEKKSMLENFRENVLKSDSFDLRFGVLQGSCLGPLLFVVYSSKFFEIIQAHLPDANCFFDDTQLYLYLKPISPTDQAEAVCAMERCISDLRKWMYQDKLNIYDDKTEFLIIGSRQQLLAINPCTVGVGATDLKPVSEVHNLGFWFDSNFSMSTNISRSCSAPFFLLGNITQISNF